MLVGLGALAAGTALLGVPTAGAENGPAYRSCAFTGGVDADFVQLLGATVNPNGNLTVAPAQRLVQLEASESSDPGDNLGHVTVSATVSSSASSQTVSGAGTGKARVNVPLAPGAASYTINWAATFDNGEHKCPSSTPPFNTPENETPKPFVLTVQGGRGGD